MPKSQQSGFDPSILRHSEIWGAADEAVLNKVHKMILVPKVVFSWSSWTVLDKYVKTANEGFFLAKIASRSVKAWLCALLGWAKSPEIISVADPWHFRVEPDPDPRIHALTNGSGPDPGSGSCYFRHWPSRCQQKTNFLTQFFLFNTFWRYINIILQS